MGSLRNSHVLHKLRSGHATCCVKLNLRDARVAEIAALCGFDCIFPPIGSQHDVPLNVEICFEHFRDVQIIFNNQDFRLFFRQFTRPFILWVAFES